jgi:hypothetical protein
MTNERFERVRAAHDELIRLGMLIDSGKPLPGSRAATMWMPNPKLTEEAQLTAEQRKALIESNPIAGDNLGEKLWFAAQFVNADITFGQPVYGFCEVCGEDSPAGPLIVNLFEPDGNKDRYEFCNWECLANWAVERRIFSRGR